MPHMASVVRVPAAGRSAARSSLPTSCSDTSSTTTAASSTCSSSPLHLQVQVHGAASSPQTPHHAWLTGDPLRTHVQFAGWGDMLCSERSPTTTKDTSAGATSCGTTPGAACKSVLGAEAPTWLGKGHTHGLATQMQLRPPGGHQHLTGPALD